MMKHELVLGLAPPAPTMGIWLLKGLVELSVTYVVQSTIVIVAVSLMLGSGRALRRVSLWLARHPSTLKAQHRFNDIRPATAERLWKFAATMALITAPLSVFAGWSHPAWEWSLTSAVSRPTLEQNVEPQRIGSQKPPTTFVEPDTPAEAKHANFAESRPSIPSIAIKPHKPLPSPITDSPKELSTDEELVQQWPVTTNSPLDSGPTNLILEVDNAPRDQEFSSSVPGVTPVIEVPQSVEPPYLPEIPYGIVWCGMALIAWMSVGLARIIGSCFSTQKMLSKCHPIDGELRRTLNRLVPQGVSIRLLHAPSENSEPFACGFWRWTIVLPQQIEQRLTRDELRALIAHEVGHLLRFDTVWLWVGEFLGKCLSFQPLNLLCARRWQQAAELLCDDWAIEQRVSATSLASCLTKIAEWRLDRQALFTSLQAIGRSGLLTRRIQWMLRDGRRFEPRPSRGRSLTMMLAFAAGLWIGICGPRLTLVVPATASEEPPTSNVWHEMKAELTATLDELDRVRSELDVETDPEVALIVERLRVRASIIRERLERASDKDGRAKTFDHESHEQNGILR